jgi:hypothetical protein
MGQTTFDQFSLLHFASGIIAYFWGLPFVWWVVIHAVFEIVENTKIGMQFINKYFTAWPGGKQHPDSFMNSMIGDNISSIVGWIFASSIDKYYQGEKFSLKHRSGNTKFKEMK